MQGLGLLLLVAILVIYMVLGILYESFIHPLTILTALPFAGFGALVTLMLFRTELSIYAFVGIIMLVGLVKKNGIMMVDFAIEAQREEGVNAREGDLRGLPRALPADHDDDDGGAHGHAPDRARASAPGAESRRPLGLAVVGGLLFSQMLTLYVTPVFYISMDRLQQRFGRKKGKGQNPRRWPRRRPVSSRRPPPRRCASPTFRGWGQMQGSATTRCFASSRSDDAAGSPRRRKAPASLFQQTFRGPRSGPLSR